MKEKPNFLKGQFMSSKKALNRVETMLESIQFIEELCEESGGIVKALDNRKLTRPAITMHLISIQEQIQKLQNENFFIALSFYSALRLYNRFLVLLKR